MKLFLERLLYSIKREMSNWLLVLIITIPIMIVIGLLATTVLVLPMYLLHFAIGDYSVLWTLFIFIAMLVWGHWGEIKKWFHWQFIEPFKKEKN